jgi:hypothetical protein
MHCATCRIPENSPSDQSGGGKETNLVVSDVELSVTLAVVEKPPRVLQLQNGSGSVEHLR